MAKEEPMWRSAQLRGKNTVGFVMKEDGVDDEGKARMFIAPDTDKAQSHSAGKPALCDIWKWLDQDFLMECVGQMQHPVEAMKKYPKDNWKKGVGDQDFIEARIESAQRHLTKLATSAIMKEARDHETSQHETACVMVNMMMVFHSLMGDKE